MTREAQLSEWEVTIPETCLGNCLSSGNLLQVIIADTIVLFKNLKYECKLLIF